MAKRTVVDCDKCGDETDHNIHIKIPNGVTREFGGHTSEIYYNYEEKDLCPQCANVREFVKQKNIEK